MNKRNGAVWALSFFAGALFAYPGIMEPTITAEVPPHDALVRRYDSYSGDFRVDYRSIDSRNNQNEFMGLSFVGRHKCSEDMVPYIDLQAIRYRHAHWKIDGNWDSSFGAGARWRPEGWNRFLGAGLYLDFEKGDVMTAQRLSLALESLGKRWDFRFNGYLPINASKRSRLTKLILYPPSTYIAYGYTTEWVLAGGELEVGYHLLDWHGIKATLDAGGYCFHHEDLNTIYGSLARLGVSYRRYLSLEVQFTHDTLVKNTWRGQVSLEIPLEKFFRGWFSETTGEELWVRKVKRNKTKFLTSDLNFYYNF